MICIPISRDEATRLKHSVSIVNVISETLDLTRSGREFLALCPFHKEETASFFVYANHYHCFGCGAHGDVIDWLVKARRMHFANAVLYLAIGARSGYRPPQPVRPSKPPRVSSNSTADVFLRCWSEGLAPSGTLVQTYLSNRGGLWVPDDAPIRFHPRCQRGSRDLPGGPEYWPAMLALMTHPITGQPVGLHRTYLLPDGSGKAPATARGKALLKPKMVIGSWGVVRLALDADVGRALGIAEGIENALTASQAIGWGPVWAIGTQDCIKKLPLLPWIEALTIFADADDSGVGLASARICASRWLAAGREAVIHIPPKGEDWNDAAKRLAHDSV